MTTHPEKRKLAAVADGGLDGNTPINTSTAVNGTTDTEKERPKKRPSTLKNSTITTAMLAMSSGTSTTRTSTTIGNKNKDPSSIDTNGGTSKLRKRWTAVEEKKLVSAVETFGTTDWAKIAANFPGRSGKLCSRKWQYLTKKATGTSCSTWTLAEENKLVSAVEVSAVETRGAHNWAEIAEKVPNRNKTQCYTKYNYLSRKATATAYGNWTEEEENKLVSAVETCGECNWAEIADMVTGRNETQCQGKWRNISRKAAVTAGGIWTGTDGGAWTAEQEQKLVSAAATFGTNCWAEIAANVPERNQFQCHSKWRSISKKAGAITGPWTVEEEDTLVYAVKTFGDTGWANVAANVPDRNQFQCQSKWYYLSRKAAATASGTLAAEEENKLVSAAVRGNGNRRQGVGTNKWAKVAANVPGRSGMQMLYQAVLSEKEGYSYC
jgi:hypothetical protein